jgi:GTPase
MYCSMLTNDISSRADVTTAEAGQCVSLALKRVRRALVRKGMVLVHKKEALPRGRFLLMRKLEEFLISHHSCSPV